MHQIHNQHIHEYTYFNIYNKNIPFRDPDLDLDLDRDAALDADLDLERDADLDLAEPDLDLDLDPFLEPAGECGFDSALPERERLEPDLDPASELRDLDLYTSGFEKNDIKNNNGK